MTGPPTGKLHFAFRGFTEFEGFRIFDFDAVDSNWMRSPLKVRTDMALAKRYGIRIQELPLLCKAVLETCHPEAVETVEFTYSEDLMCQHASAARAKTEASAKSRKFQRPGGTAASV